MVATTPRCTGEAACDRTSAESVPPGPAAASTTWHAPFGGGCLRAARTTSIGTLSAALLAAASALHCARAEAQAGAASAAGFALTPPALLRAPTQRGERIRLVCTAQGACLGLSISSWRAHAPSTRERRWRRAVARAAPITPAQPLRALPVRSGPDLGKRVALGAGRELSLQLTPTPTRCAPLFKITY